MKPLPYTRELCDRYQSFKMQVDELNGLKSGLIRIGTFSSVATHWLPKIIREFQKDYPNIDYELILRRIPYRIITRELDVPAYRRIGIALRDKKSASIAVRRFLEYLQYR